MLLLSVSLRARSGHATATVAPQAPGPQVTLAHRYTAAWAEINTRLVSRQTVSLYYATVSVTTASLIISTMTGTQSGAFLLNGWADGISVGLVGLTWTFTLWIRHNDATIGLLSAYCRSLELIDDPENRIGLPAWHNEAQGWILRARTYRRYSDRAVIVVTLIAILPAVLVTAYHVTVSDVMSSLLLLPTVLLGVLAVVFTYRNATARQAIAHARFQQTRSGWVFGSPFGDGNRRA